MNIKYYLEVEWLCLHSKSYMDIHCLPKIRLMVGSKSLFITLILKSLFFVSQTS